MNDLTENFLVGTPYSFQDGILKVCTALNTHGVNYLIIGGTAFAIYGRHRMSIEASGKIATKHDFDFWYAPTYENYYKLLKALASLGIDTSEWLEEQIPNPRKSFFRQEFDSFKVDFLPEVIGLNNFDNSFANRKTLLIADTAMHFISKSDLIKSKEANNRAKDIDDLNELKNSSSDEN